MLVYIFLCSFVVVLFAQDNTNATTRCHTHRVQEIARSHYHHQKHHFSNQDVRPGVTHNDCVDEGKETCEDCCDGVCCESVGSIDPFPEGMMMWVPVNVIVVRQTSIDRNVIVEQFRSLNTDYASTSIFFTLNDIIHVSNPTLASKCNSDPCVGDMNCEFYRLVLQPVILNSNEYMHVVICSTPYLGESSFPWLWTENDYRKYVQVSFQAVKGLVSDGSYALGKTLTHETGHYFGLLHTFWRDGECDVAGDYVSDTPNQNSQTSSKTSCDAKIDSCPNSPGLDDTSNYMDYSADQCMTHFTPGQIIRMQQMTRKYLGTLYNKRSVLGKCSGAAPNVTASCTCSNGMSPSSWCTAAGATSAPPPSSPSQLTPSPLTTPQATTTTPSPTTTTSPPPNTNSVNTLCRDATLCQGGGKCVVDGNGDQRCSCFAWATGTHCEFCVGYFSGETCGSAVAAPDSFRATITNISIPRKLLAGTFIQQATTTSTGSFTVNVPNLNPGDTVPFPIVITFPKTTSVNLVWSLNNNGQLTTGANVCSTSSDSKYITTALCRNGKSFSFSSLVNGTQVVPASSSSFDFKVRRNVGGVSLVGFFMFLIIMLF
eukprot:PhF_6_TR29335/c0_g1_i2/m.43062